MSAPPPSDPAEISGPHTPSYERIYHELNPQGAPEVNAGAAAHFLKTSNLDMTTLAKIWELADYRRAGSLDKRGAFVAFKLVAGLQQGLPLHPNLISAHLTQPPRLGSQQSDVFQRSNSVMSQGGMSAGRSSVGPASPSMPTQPPFSATASDWEIEPAEQQKYESIFFSLNPVNGKLSGEAVRPVLLNSQLPHLHLAKIWELADIDKDGQLDKYEMCIALHLVYKCLQNPDSLPATIPMSLVHPMKRALVSSMISGVSMIGNITPINQPPSRRTSWATGSGSSPAPPRISMTLGSRTSSISSLNKSIASDEISKAPVPIGAGALTPGFCSLFEQMDAPTWPVDTSKYEADFRRIDTDHDGIELTNECRHGVKLPESLPQFLIPPSIAPQTNKPLSVSQSNASVGSNSGTTAPPPLSNNPVIIELTEEIEKILENRRQAEQDLFQLEADTTVKNSEIKNLEIELLTLSATVKQLEHQKGEANKRLSEMDDTITKLETVCAENAERLAAEEERLNKVKQDIAQANDNFNEEEEMLRSLRDEANEVEEVYSKAKNNLDGENRKIERLVDELTMMERRTDANEKEMSHVEKLTTELESFLKKVEEETKKDDAADGDRGASEIDYEEVLRLSFQRIVLNAEGVVSPSSITPHPKAFESSISDPFKQFSGQVDPFEGADAHPDEVAKAFGADPFGGDTKDTGFANFANFSSFPS
ncbi:cytoskeletal-regulatory complex EF hand domain-containing protein [Ditylenchus destructor]|nr:cytoskeletal-regulatory complex EF hand domain-containing protein [Ditylenchus destructor]